MILNGYCNHRNLVFEVKYELLSTTFLQTHPHDLACTPSCPQGDK